ncbi:MAG: hypothetical protein MI723_00170 [Caulobacterales bacterium]|nr:hypothetical protein [Caulobacterales bacterium]
MELTSHRVAETRAADARAALGRYLSAHGLSARLADGPVGDHYLARAQGSQDPSGVFAEWFGELLDMPVDEAEDAGWIAFLATRPTSPDLLLASIVSSRAVERMRAATPLPAREEHLSMPAHHLEPPSIRAALARLAKAAGGSLMRALAGPLAWTGHTR